MGGNALKNIVTKRLSLSEFHRVQSSLSQSCGSYGIAHTYPIEMPGKTSFGDVDMLISFSESPHTNVKKQNFLPWLQKTFSPVTDYTINGPCYSFAYESQYQIDAILVDNLQMANFFYSYGDIGAVLGHCFTAHGLSFSDNGLWRKPRPDKKDFVQIQLTNNPQAICEYIGLSMETWLTGFTHVNDINHWITDPENRIFHPSLFSMNNASSRMQRYLERPFTAQFLQHLSTLPSSPAFDSRTTGIRDLRDEAIDYFDKRNEMNEQLEVLKQKAELKAKFNGKFFIERGIPPLKIKQAMNEFEAMIDVERSSAEEIQRAIDNFIVQNPQFLENSI